jgi:hypothetical protein
MAEPAANNYQPCHRVPHLATSIRAARGGSTCSARVQPGLVLINTVAHRWYVGDRRRRLAKAHRLPRLVSVCTKGQRYDADATSNPSDEVIEWFWKIVKGWPAERKVRVTSSESKYVADGAISPDCCNSPPAHLVSPSTASRIFRARTALDDSPSRRLGKSRNCQSLTRVSTVSTCQLTRATMRSSRSSPLRESDAWYL